VSVTLKDCMYAACHVTLCRQHSDATRSMVEPVPCLDGQQARRPRLDVGAGADGEQHHDEEGIEVKQRRHRAAAPA
jgi:hypothetical protein